MANNDLFGGFGNLGNTLGGLVGGLAKSGLVPQDDPGVKLINAQSELSELQKQEDEILVEIGRRAFEATPDDYPQAEKLRLIRANMADAKEKLEALKQEQEQAEAAKAAKAAENAKNNCQNCGHYNPEGVKFCQECGTKLGTTYCTGCGAELKPGTRFCGECGARQGEV